MGYQPVLGERKTMVEMTLTGVNAARIRDYLAALKPKLE
jgi:hypothetical protein